MLWQYHQLVLATELFGKVPVLEFDATAYDCYLTLLEQNPALRKSRLRNDMRIASLAEPLLGESHYPMVQRS
jgi:tRNA(fMet)-specific endonuclease VapC